MTITAAACALALAVCGTALPVAAQETATFHQKSGTAATVLSVLVPGAGHIYTGETGKGLALLGIGVGGFTFGAYMWQRNVVDDMDDCDDIGCALTSSTKHSAWAYAGMLAFVGSWVYGVADAGSSANRMNERGPQVTRRTAVSRRGAHAAGCAGLRIAAR
jgi:hypothetical protein